MREMEVEEGKVDVLHAISHLISEESICATTSQTRLHSNAIDFRKQCTSLVLFCAYGYLQRCRQNLPRSALLVADLHDLSAVSRSLSLGQKNPLTRGMNGCDYETHLTKLWNDLVFLYYTGIDAPSQVSSVEDHSNLLRGLVAELIGMMVHLTARRKRSIAGLGLHSGDG